MARETDQEQRDRKDQEKADYVRARQERLGDVPASEEVAVEETKEAAPKAKSPSRTRSSPAKKG